MDKARYQVQFEKDKTYLKAYLEGRDYFMALKALGFLERLTLGKYRKDGVTLLRKDGKMPELHHQVRLALAISQLKTLSSDKSRGMSIEEACILGVILHDVLEDFDEIDRSDLESEFGRGPIESVWRVTKKRHGVAKNKEVYIEEISKDLVAAIVKGLDRNDNLEHMIGVFDLKKIVDYTDEAEKVFLPMLKKASKLFPEHMQAFQAIMQRMKRNIKFTRTYIEVKLSEEQLRTNVDDLKHSLRDSNEQYVDNLRAMKSNYEENLRGVETELKDRHDLVRRQATALESAHQTINQQSAEIKELKFQVESRQSTINSKQRVIDGVNDRLEAFEQKIGLLPAQLFNKIRQALIVGRDPAEQLFMEDKLRVALGVSELEGAQFNQQQISGFIDNPEIPFDTVSKPTIISKFRDHYKK